MLKTLSGACTRRTPSSRGASGDVGTLSLCIPYTAARTSSPPIPAKKLAAWSCARCEDCAGLRAASLRGRTGRRAARGARPRQSLRHAAGGPVETPASTSRRLRRPPRPGGGRARRVSSGRGCTRMSVADAPGVHWHPHKAADGRANTRVAHARHLPHDIVGATRDSGGKRTVRVCPRTGNHVAQSTHPEQCVAFVDALEAL